MTIGRLCTKDGRKIGNAFCYKIDEEENCFLETDFGNKISIPKVELLNYFYIMQDPLYISYEQWKDEKNKNSS